MDDKYHSVLWAITIHYNQIEARKFLLRCLINMPFVDEYYKEKKDKKGDKKYERELTEYIDTAWGKTSNIKKDLKHIYKEARPFVKMRNAFSHSLLEAQKNYSVSDAQSIIKRDQTPKKLEAFENNLRHAITKKIKKSIKE